MPPNLFERERSVRAGSLVSRRSGAAIIFSIPDCAILCRRASVRSLASSRCLPSREQCVNRFAASASFSWPKGNPVVSPKSMNSLSLGPA